jgi:TRAP-type C4-dicarboxylate transport system permease small subunit
MLDRLIILLTPIEKYLAKILEVFCVLLLALIIIDVTAAIFCRYIIYIPLLFAESLAKYMFIWFTFGGAVLAFRQGAHISVELIDSFLSTHTRWRLSVNTFILITGSIFFLLVIYYGGKYAFKSRFVKDPFVFELSMIYTYSSVCICSLFMLMEFMFQNLKLLSRQLGKEAEVEN